MVKVRLTMLNLTQPNPNPNANRNRNPNCNRNPDPECNLTLILTVTLTQPCLSFLSSHVNLRCHCLPLVSCWMPYCSFLSSHVKLRCHCLPLVSCWMHLRRRYLGNIASFVQTQWLEQDSNAALQRKGTATEQARQRTTKQRNRTNSFISFTKISPRWTSPCPPAYMAPANCPHSSRSTWAPSMCLPYVGLGSVLGFG